jgi:FKBP-type peptidyl-prolyl cis-trans isomerase
MVAASRKRPRALALVAVSATLLAACGSGKTKTADIPDSNTPAASVPTTAPTPTPSGKTGPNKPLPAAPGEKDLKKKPAIPKPKPDPPAKLIVRDIVKGKGAPLKKGQNATLNYVGVLWSSGKELDSTFGGAPYKFVFGTGGVIPGWDKGMKGMRVGGRRQLIVPPDLAYGPQGSPPDVPPNETLIFDIDLLKAK